MPIFLAGWEREGGGGLFLKREDRKMGPDKTR